jgi:hypothetical protein
VETLVKLGLLEEAKLYLEAKTMREAKKTDGKECSNIRGMTKLEEAMLAGTAKSKECTLILTKGDSAAEFAISSLKEVSCERWGVFFFLREDPEFGAGQAVQGYFGAAQWSRHCDGRSGSQRSLHQRLPRARILLPARVQSMEGLELPDRMENQIL